MEKPTSFCHVVVMPYPGRGHMNPIMNLCQIMCLKNPYILFTFVVTQEWHDFFSNYSKPDCIKFATIPNVIPSELDKVKDFPGFLEAVATKMEAPFEQLLDRLELAVNVILADTLLGWVVGVGNRRNIPVASLWTMPALVFSIFHHFDLLLENGHFPVQLSERGEECVDYIPGIPSIRLSDFPTMFDEISKKALPQLLEAVSMASKAQYLLFTSPYELESQVIDALKSNFPFPVLPLGPIIPYFELETKSEFPYYLEWLNSQPKDSVLYISLGSLLSVSSTQMDEMVAGVLSSGVRFLLVSLGGENSLFKDGYSDKGLVVPWCDQLRVLCHPSVGGFWTNCGWNSTLEGIFAGVPMLTSPMFADQIPNSKQIVEDWRIGWSVIKKGVDDKNMVTREEIAKLVQSFMDVENSGVKEIRKNARQLQEACETTMAKGGFTNNNFDFFLRDISQCQAK